MKSIDIVDDQDRLSREDVGRTFFKLYDDAEVNKKWGQLVCVVSFKNGSAHLIERHFTEKFTAKSFK